MDFERTYLRNALFFFVKGVLHWAYVYGSRLKDVAEKAWNPLKDSLHWSTKDKSKIKYQQGEKYVLTSVKKRKD